MYGNLPFGSDKKNKFSITSPYAQDKLALENYAKMSFEVFGTSSVGLRLYNVYGPGQDLSRKDQVLSAHRSHFHYLAKGGS